MTCKRTKEWFNIGGRGRRVAPKKSHQRGIDGSNDARCSRIRERRKRMRVGRILCVAVMGLVVLGCAGSSKRMNTVRLGMTQQEVVESIGKPDSASAIEDMLYLKYRLRSNGLFTSEYYVRLQNGRVDAYGQVGDFGLGY
jgi:hypothetical protein